MNSTGISVIIPNYNGEKLLSEVLPSILAALNHTRLPFEIIISDDASSDQSVAFVKKNYPDIIVIGSDNNQGFSPTINRGIFKAQFSHLLLLNSDVKLEMNYFQPLLRYFERSDTFGVMGRIVGWNNDNIQDGAKYPSFHGVKIKTSGNYYSLDPKPDDWLYSMYLSGANAFVDRRKIQLLGGFDELFAPFYVEDYELSLRAWRMGWKCYYEHYSVCHHKESTSIKTKSKKNYINIIYYRNKLFLHAMHLKGNKLLLWYLQLIPETIFSIFTFKFYFLSSLKSFFQNRKGMLASIRNFEVLAKSQSITLLSVREVADTVKASMENIPIKKF